MSTSITYNKAQLAKILNSIDRLQTQLPSHQVAAQRRAGEYLAAKMRNNAKKMHYDGKVEKSIGWKESHGVVGGHVLGKTSVVVIGPGAQGQMPIHAPLMETGWSGGWWPNMTRLTRWAARRIANIQPRQVFYIARAIAARGALSPRNPRARGEKGYHYVERTFKDEGSKGLQIVLDEGFGQVKSTLDDF